MLNYCNARLPVALRTHAIESQRRAHMLGTWLARHTDDDVVAMAKRKRMTRPREPSISVAFRISPAQATRLSQLLDGRKNTFSALVRNIFAEV